jgi:hypothetical protein
MTSELVDTQAPAGVVNVVAPTPGVGHGPPVEGGTTVATGVGEGAILGR